mmetsp:Transcript_29571/g.62152  ORF Transcript_29571/g.62152 Transcript_29571/m.62152 type:complete len:220 (-) Transcript_29571:571-1230(-)
MNPGSQRRICLISLGNHTISKCLFISFQFVEFDIPRRLGFRADTPSEPDGFKSLNTFNGQCARISLYHESKLTALSHDPSSELWVDAVASWYLTVSILFMESCKGLELLFPAGIVFVIGDCVGKAMVWESKPFWHNDISPIAYQAVDGVERSAARSGRRPRDFGIGRKVNRWLKKSTSITNCIHLDGKPRRKVGAQVIVGICSSKIRISIGIHKALPRC